jgi:hypothetical protein
MAYLLVLRGISTSVRGHLPLQPTGAQSGILTHYYWGVYLLDILHPVPPILSGNLAFRSALLIRDLQ